VSAGDQALCANCHEMMPDHHDGCSLESRVQAWERAAIDARAEVEKLAKELGRLSKSEAEWRDALRGVFSRTCGEQNDRGRWVADIDAEVERLRADLAHERSRPAGTVSTIPAIAAGREDRERRNIVAWLRRGNAGMAVPKSFLADAIEKGEHEPSPSDVSQPAGGR
jgi:hypothetical protein